MLDHWEKVGPPVYISVAGYLNWGGTAGKTEDKKSQEEYGNLNDLVAMFGGSGGAIGV